MIWTPFPIRSHNGAVPSVGGGPVDIVQLQADVQGALQGEGHPQLLAGLVGGCPPLVPEYQQVCRVPVLDRAVNESSEVSQCPGGLFLVESTY